MAKVEQRFLDASWMMHVSGEPSKEVQQIGPIYKEMMAKAPIAPGMEMEGIDDSTPANLKREDVQVASQNCYFYSDPARDKDTKRLVFYIHGGALIMGNGKLARSQGIAACNNLNLPVFVVEYRLSPQVKFPAHLDDVYASWKYLIEEKGYKAEDLIVLGDSAGGQLALDLTVRLKLRGEKLPGYLLLCSPCTNANYSFPAHKDNIPTDILFPNGLTTQLTAMCADEKDWSNPELSAYFADVSGFPPAYFVTEDEEVLRDDTLYMADKLDKAGVKVLVRMFHGTWHDFALGVPQVPEAQLMFKDMREFIK
ncbi:MAG: alpha/beta hydrolase [Spirochaetaceae bacterium]|jgi:acetyl esterase/lipase|nr:alpha/beta hydrolase [Spirochaetaceae bacterium]